MALNHHDQEIVDLYREGSTEEPPATLDAAILSAARVALAEPSSPKRKVGWWRRFSLPMQFAASFVLVAMVSILVTRQADEPEDLNRHEAKAVAPAASSAATVAAQAESAAVPPAAPQPAKSAELANRVDRVSRAEPAKAAPPQRKANDPRADSAAAMPLPAPAPLPAIEPAKTQATGGVSPPMAAVAPTPRALAKSERVEETLASLAKDSNAAPKSVKDWLDEITALLNREKIVEARQLLEAFQKAYPDEVLPDTLKKRLTP